MAKTGGVRLLGDADEENRWYSVGAVTALGDGSTRDFSWYNDGLPASRFAFHHVGAQITATEIRPDKVWDRLKVWAHLEGCDFSTFRWPGMDHPPLPRGEGITIELIPLENVVQPTADEIKAAEKAAEERSKENKRAASLNVWNGSPWHLLHVQCAGEIFGPERCLELQDGARRLLRYNETAWRQIVGWLKQFQAGSRKAFYRRDDAYVEAPALHFDTGDRPLRLTGCCCAAISIAWTRTPKLPSVRSQATGRVSLSLRLFR